jgi:hypothetical protein
MIYSKLTINDWLNKYSPDQWGICLFHWSIYLDVYLGYEQPTPIELCISNRPISFQYINA